jgi:hypothetical protein
MSDSRVRPYINEQQWNMKQFFVTNVTRCLWPTTVVIATSFQMSNHADYINYIGILWNDESLRKSCDIQQDKYEVLLFIYES